MRWCLRPTDLTARSGTEQFRVMLPGAPRDGARAAATRLRETIGKTDITEKNGESLPKITASVGVAQLGDKDDAVSLLRSARAALARARRNGRGRVECEGEA